MLVKYVKRVDGFFGCYRGLVAYLLYKSIYIYSCQSISVLWDGWGKPDPKEVERLRIQKFLERTRRNVDGTPAVPVEAEEEEVEEVYNFHAFLKELARDLACRLGGVTISYPFCVIAVQQMAAFVGRERIMTHVRIHMRQSH